MNEQEIKDDGYYAVEIINPVRNKPETQLCIKGKRLKRSLQRGGFYYNKFHPNCKILSWDVDNSLWAKDLPT